MALIIRRSQNSLHLPGSVMAKIGESQGLQKGSTCPCCNCSCTKRLAGYNISPFSGNFSSQISFSVSQMRVKGMTTVVPMKMVAYLMKTPKINRYISNIGLNECCLPSEPVIERAALLWSTKDWVLMPTISRGCSSARPNLRLLFSCSNNNIWSCVQQS